MKSYKCRIVEIEKSTGKAKPFKSIFHEENGWHEVLGSSPQDAVEDFADTWQLTDGYYISVRGVGIFSIDIEKIYHAYQVKTRG